MDSWQNLLSDSMKSECKYDKLHDHCRFAVVPSKNRFFLYIFVIIAMIYSCRSVVKLNHVLERLDHIIPEESLSIIPDVRSEFNSLGRPQ